ncbi:MAG: TonB-dependent siderophore receptor [Cyanobacteria bacterium P01_C01_bin.70]
MAYRWQVMTGLATAIAVGIVQPAVAQVTQIDQVQINAVNGTLEVRLVTTDDAPPQSFISSYGETVVIDLINTQLSLPTGDRIVQADPAAGVASIQVSPLDENSVRIIIVGREQAPTVNLAEADGVLIVSAAIAGAVAEQPPAAQPDPTDEETPADAAEPPQAPTDPTDETVPDADDGPATATPPAAEDGIRILVTGESAAESGYLAPETATGTRTNTSIFEIPQTIQVIPQQVLEDQQVIRLREALRNVPNAVEGNTFGGTSEEFVIRGFSAATILRDGFRTANTDEATAGFEEIANVERVEVLSGPASILYGSIEPGGVINLVTKQPLPEFFAEAEVQIGSFGLVRPTVDISGPLTEDSGMFYRLNAAYEYSDGFRDFETDMERFFIAPVVAWEISDRTTLTFELEYLDDRRPFDRGIPPIGDEVADVPLDTVIGEPNDFAEVETLNVGYRLEHEFSDQWQLRNRFRYRESDFLNRRTEVSFPLGGVDETTGNVARSFDANEATSESFELLTEVVGEFTTGSIEHTVLFGFDVLYSDNINLATTDFAPPVNLFNPQTGRVEAPELPLALTLLDADVDLTQFGVILQNQIQLLPNLTVLLGGRLDVGSQERQTEPVFIPGFISSPGADEQQDFSKFSPRVGIVYQPIDPVYLYASYSQSFRPNTLAQTTVDGDFLDPEEAEQFEVGVKAELLDGRLAATLAFFDITLENIAASDPNNSAFIVPIGQQTNRGVELAVQGEILPGWNVIASYGFIDAEIEESEDFPDGATPRNVPENTASLFTTYEIQAGTLEGLGFGLGLFFVDRRFGDNDNTFELDSYWRTDATVFYRRDQFQLGVNFRNLFDVNYFESAVDRRGANPGEPFTVLGSVSFTF